MKAKHLTKKYKELKKNDRIQYYLAETYEVGNLTSKSKGNIYIRNDDGKRIKISAQKISAGNVFFRANDGFVGGGWCKLQIVPA